jgi:RNA polymerase sigma factor (sigma-70 family)
MYASTDQPRRERLQALAEQLYRERRRYLLRIALRNAASYEDAEEAVQEAFAAFIRAFDPDRGAPPLAWLTLTLKRECWARRRKGLRRSAGQEISPDSPAPGVSIASIATGGASPEETIERAERVIEARQRLARLKPAERRALGMIAAGYSYREVGEISGWTYTKINRCASEGRSALRKTSAA